MNIADIKMSCGSNFKRIWPYIFFVILVITHMAAVTQVARNFLFVLIIIIAAFKVKPIIAFLSNFTGLDFVYLMNHTIGLLFLITLSFVIFACAHLILTAMLCRGLLKSEIHCVVPFIIEDVILLGFRVCAILSSYGFHNFHEDLTLTCGLYGLYLVLLGIVYVDIRRTKPFALREIPMTSLNIRARA